MPGSSSSKPIWFLTSRNRPTACQEVLDACEATGMTSPGLLWVDGGEGQRAYRKLRLPANWSVRYAKGWGSIGPAHKWVFENYPNASHYGWLADDTVPRTRGWDELLQNAAGHGCIAYAKDLWMSEDAEMRGSLVRGSCLSSGVCYAGDLVRAVGWLALPGLVQAGIDTAWTAVVGKLCRGVYVEDVVVEHKHYVTGKRVDEGWSAFNLPHIDRDLKLRDEWVASKDYWDTLERVSKLCPLVTGEQKEAREAVEFVIYRYARLARVPPKEVVPPLARRRAQNGSEP